jgi:glyoxylase-like metal-dependent hydrolase (beta-lactamase superfamily II)
MEMAMFKVRQITTNLVQLTWWGMFNSYLVREEGGLTAVDTGLNQSAPDILKAVAAQGLPVTRIALTHAHGDHAGSLDALAAALPEAEVAFGERTARFLDGDLALAEGEPQAPLRGSFVRHETQATRLLKPGERLGSLQVIAAPGHTPDQIAFFDVRDGALLAGDAFQTQAGLAVTGVLRWLFPFPALATWHLPAALDTAIRLRDLRPARLAVGHGRVLVDPLAAMDEAIAAAQGKVHGQTQTA